MYEDLSRSLSHVGTQDLIIGPVPCRNQKADVMLTCDSGGFRYGPPLLDSEFIHAQILASWGNIRLFISKPYFI